MLNYLMYIYHIDFNKKQEECSKLVEEYSEEFKVNYSELKQTVDSNQKNLTSVRLLLKKLAILYYEVHFIYSISIY